MKNLKRLMSVVLSVVMLMSFVVSTSAASFTDVAETDKAYEAIEVLAALKILEGKEAGVFEPEANIKRSEFAAVICRAMNQESAAVGSSSFTDVAIDHWAYSYIGWAASQGIVNGRGDGTFDPDANVTYNEAIKMIVCAMGYEWYAENMMGGYPSGYARIAGSYNIDADINAASGNAAATRADVATLVYNAFDAPLMDVKYISLEPEYAIYDGSKSVDYEKRTLLSYYADTYKIKATVDSTYRNDNSLVQSNGDKKMEMTMKSLYKFDEVDVEDALNMNINNTDGTFSVIANDEAWAGYQGYTVNAYITVNERDKAEVVAMVPDTSSADELEIANARDLIAVADVDDTTGEVTFEYYESSDATRTKSLRIADDATVYVNNIIVGTLDNGGTAETEFESLAAGYYASVTVLGTDGDYDKIYLTNYEYGIVEEVDTDLEIIETTGNSYYLSADDTSDEFVYNIYKDDVKIDLADLAEGDLLNVVIGDLSGDVENATFVDIYVTTNVVESTVSAVGGNSTDGYVYEIDGVEYYLATNAQVSSLRAGDTGSFYITIDGYIYDADFTSTFSDNYAFVLDVAESSTGFGTTWEIKLLDKYNAIRIIPVKSSVYITDDNNTKESFKTESGSANLQNTYFTTLQGKIHNATTSTIAAAVNERMITFKESNGEITELIFAKSSGTDRDFKYEGLSGSYSDKTGLLAGYEVVDSTYLFSVPTDDDNIFVASTMYNASPSDKMIDENMVQVYSTSSLDTETSYTGFAYNVEEDGVLGAALLTNELGFAGSADALAIVQSVSDGLNSAGDPATLVKFWQNGEVQSLAIAESAFIGTNIFSSTSTNYVGDVFQYTTNSAGEINGTELIYDYSAKALQTGGKSGDITYHVGIVENITAKRLTLDNGSESSFSLAWNSDLGTNVLFNVARSASNVSNAFSVKSSTSYMKAYTLKDTAGTASDDSDDIFNSDVYIAVVRADDSAIVDVVAYQYDAGTTVWSTFIDGFTSVAPTA